jgi:hypothetical protein
MTSSNQTSETPSIAPLTPDQAGPFRNLTFPSIGSRIEKLSPSWALWGAAMGGIPIGLAVVCPGATAGEFLLKSVSVAPSHRRQGVGRGLLQAVEADVESRGATRLFARFTPTMKMASAFVGLTHLLQWSKPKIVSLNLTGEAGPMAQKGGEWPGVKAWLTEPGAFSFDPWQPLNDGDLDALARLRAQRAYRPYLAFEGFVADVDPVCSLQIRRAGELVGWILATPFQGAMVARYGDRIGRWYRSAYVDEALWRSAALIAGYQHAFSRQGEVYGNESIATYFTDFPAQMALTRRRFASMALSMEEIHEVSRPIRLRR